MEKLRMIYLQFHSYLTLIINTLEYKTYYQSNDKT